MAALKTSKVVVTKRRIMVRGLTDLMFDRYAGDNKTELRVDQKFYFSKGKKAKRLVIPAVNVLSFLCAQNTPSAAKRFLDSRQYKKIAQAILCYTLIEPFEIPLVRDGKPVEFVEFDEVGLD